MKKSTQTKYVKNEDGRSGMWYTETVKLAMSTVIFEYSNF